MDEADVPLLLEALPVAERAARPARIEAVRPVRAPDDAVLVARRGTEVPGAPCVEERHAPAAAPVLVGSGAAGLRPERGPGAHDARADHAHVGRRRQVGRARWHRLGHGARISVGRRPARGRPGPPLGDRGCAPLPPLDAASTSDAGITRREVCPSRAGACRSLEPPRRAGSRRRKRCPPGRRRGA